jgi:hypothetical protein
MRDVPVDLENHQLDLIQILSMLEASDDFGAPIWLTLKNTSLEGPDLRKINWAQKGIEDKVSWDKLGGTLSCDRYKD